MILKLFSHGENKKARNSFFYFNKLIKFIYSKDKTTNLNNVLSKNLEIILTRIIEVIIKKTKKIIHSNLQIANEEKGLFIKPIKLS